MVPPANFKSYNIYPLAKFSAELLEYHMGFEKNTVKLRLLPPGEMKKAYDEAEKDWHTFLLLHLLHTKKRNEKPSLGHATITAVRNTI